MTIAQDELAAFKDEILGIAANFKLLLPYEQTPTKTSAELSKLEKTLTKTLDVLVGLDLCHKEGQDLESCRFNYPLALELQTHYVIAETFRKRQPCNVESEDTAYPTNLIFGLEVLRDASRAALKKLKPKRGNSSNRDQSVAVKEHITKNLVLRYRIRFGNFPPTTKEGSSGLVEILENAFEHAGTTSSGAAHWLQKMVKAGRSAVE